MFDRIGDLLNSNESNLLTYSSAGNVDRVKKLLDKGVNVNCRDKSINTTPLHNALRFCHSENGSFGWDFKKGDLRYIETIKLLIERGADVYQEDMHGNGAIVDAVKKDEEIAKLFFPPLVKLNINCRDGRGNSLFTHAKTLVIAKMLIDRGANIHAKNDRGETPLNYLVACGDSIDKIKLLIEHGADVHAKNKEGDTPLHKAVKFSWIYPTNVLLTMLLDKGAASDIYLQNDKGETPFDLANDEIKAIFKQYIQPQQNSSVNPPKTANASAIKPSLLSTQTPIATPAIKPAAAVASSQTPNPNLAKSLIDGQGKIIISFAIEYKDLQLGNELGRGSYGVVYQGEHNYTPVAIKKLLNQNLNAASVEQFKQEASIMASLRSPYIVQLYGICLEKPHYGLVMEYMAKGSLYSLLQSEEDVSWTIRYQIALDVGYGLAFLHKQNIIHADLKSLNVLLDNHYKAKISDFGLAKVKVSSSGSTVMGPSSGGSTKWMAPELFEDEDVKSTKASDAYSYGMVLWELGARKDPFMNSRAEVVPTLVMKGKRETITQDTPPSMAKLITRCWEGRAEQRPGIDEAVKILRDNQNEVIALEKASQVASGYRNNLASN